MKNISRILIIVLLSCVAWNQAAGQKRSFIRSADDAFADERYTVAIEKYQKAYTKLKKNPVERDRISFQLAECYRLTGETKRADIQYKRLIKNGFDSKEPIILLHYAIHEKPMGTWKTQSIIMSCTVKKCQMIQGESTAWNLAISFPDGKNMNQNMK